jgi:hypothetical protein
VKPKTDGTGNRYANDGTGNHIDRIRKQSLGMPMFKDFTKRLCRSCGKRKPVKGGSGVGKRFKCESCKSIT